MTHPLGLDSTAVLVVPYDPRWPELFQVEVQRLSAAMAAAGLPALAFEHIGSTAVRGLAAKPILDILAGRDRAVPPSVYVPALEAAEYVHRGELGVPGREFLRRGMLRTHHLHLVERGGENWRRYLRLRDILRTSPELRSRYASLKHELAHRYPRDREAYTKGKSDLIERILSQP